RRAGAGDLVLGRAGDAGRRLASGRAPRREFVDRWPRDRTEGDRKDRSDRPLGPVGPQAHAPRLRDDKRAAPDVVRRATALFDRVASDLADHAPARAARFPAEELRADEV